MSSDLANRGRLGRVPPVPIGRRVTVPRTRRSPGPVRRDRGIFRVNQAVRMSFLFTNSSAASRPISREVPLRLTPPNGSSGESASTTLT